MRFKIYPCSRVKGDTILCVTEIVEENKEINRLTSIELAILRKIGVMECSARLEGKQTFHFATFQRNDVLEVLRGFLITPEAPEEEELPDAQDDR